MKSPLRVLIVDAGELDAQLISRELGQLPSALEIQRVDAAAGLLCALEQPPFDLILCEWTLPAWSGAAALALCRDKQPDVPAIVVSNEAAEDAIVEAIRSGARDYVHKDRLSRLLPAAERELQRCSAARVSRLAGQAWQRSEAQMVALLASGLAAPAPSAADAVQDLAVADAAKRWLKLGPAPERELRHSQKIEAVGRLAGVVAHEFNNLMSIVVTYSTLIAQELPRDSALQADLKEIKHAGERATALTRQLLAFSQRPVAQPVLVDLNRVIEGMERVLHRLLGDGVQLSLIVEPKLARTLVDPQEIEQLVLNLVANARDAMSQGGRLVVETANVSFADSYVAEHPGARPGAHVMLAVTDTGSGMDESTQAQLFEPFFSTKPVGKNLGLGLATVLSIVQQREGSIWVDSTPGEGSTFRVYLPTASERSLARSSLRPSRMPRAEDGALRGAETILLVEDDASVRAGTRALLKNLGYQVLDACDASEALRAARQHAHAIHLLLSDVALPQMDGKALAEQLLDTRPETKVLFMSGQPDAMLAESGVLRSGWDVVGKPVPPDALARKLRKLLEPHSR